MVDRVTLADVSREVGLGVATVSRALAIEPHPEVSERTRQRVREAADRLGYRPSLAARALRSGRQRVMSVIVPDRFLWWWERSIRAAFRHAHELGYELVVHPIAGREGVGPVIESLSSTPTEGVLLFGYPDHREAMEATTRLRLPVVAIDNAEFDVLCPTLSVDDRLGAFMAVAHLAGLGRSRIAYLGSRYEGQFFQRERRAGYQEALAAAGLQTDPELVSYCADPWNESIQEFPEIESLVAGGARFDAVFCEFDALAARLYRSLRRQGLTVPGDVAVVGSDDERAALWIEPPLTSVRPPHQEMARRAVDLLHGAVTGGSLVPGRELLKPTLVRRQST